MTIILKLCCFTFSANWSERIDGQKLREDCVAMHEGETKAQAHLQSYGPSQAFHVHDLVHQPSNLKQLEAGKVWEVGTILLLYNPSCLNLVFPIFS